MPINILCDKLSLYEYRGNLYLMKDLRKINVLKKKIYLPFERLRNYLPCSLRAFLSVILHLKKNYNG